MILGEKGDLYLGATFSDYIAIDNIKVASNGGSDIFLAKLNSDGKMGGYRHFGSPDDENVKKVAQNFDGLSFGGEVSGKTRDRTIGDVEFICSGFVDHEAYTSSVWDEDFKVGKTGTKVSKPGSKANVIANKLSKDIPNLNVSVYPNPFNSSFFINVNCTEKSSYTVRLLDVLGREIWKQENTNSKTYEINTDAKLENGVYFIQVKGSNGEVSSHKIVKQ